MSLMFIRVLAGFLAGLAAGILMMRVAYKKKGFIKADEGETPDTAISSRAS
ncbi:MAG: hypothetical protein WA655_02800 [Candidatus Korobacteraceae bacterium]